MMSMPGVQNWIIWCHKHNVAHHQNEKSLVRPPTAFCPNLTQYRNFTCSTLRCCASRCCLNSGRLRRWQRRRGGNNSCWHWSCNHCCDHCRNHRCCNRCSRCRCGSCNFRKRGRGNRCHIALLKHRVEIICNIILFVTHSTFVNVAQIMSAYIHGRFNRTVTKQSPVNQV